MATSGTIGSFPVVRIRTPDELGSVVAVAYGLTRRVPRPVLSLKTEYIVSSALVEFTNSTGEVVAVVSSGLDSSYSSDVPPPGEYTAGPRGVARTLSTKSHRHSAAG